MWAWLEIALAEKRPDRYSELYEVISEMEDRFGISVYHVFNGFGDESAEFLLSIHARIGEKIP